MKLVASVVVPCSRDSVASRRIVPSFLLRKSEFCDTGGRWQQPHPHSLQWLRCIRRGIASDGRYVESKMLRNE